ncbi:asparagine synthase-related protein [Rhodococcus sp. 2G]|uniref:asparagine synthase-related protein n=1 Tax=Rhodococcus sp. 2G TaxID=1570939 RepID=UPI0012EC1A8A|nr:asparagine synthase-related protein [Rhodococcus sp. 2G]
MRSDRWLADEISFGFEGELCVADSIFARGLTLSWWDGTHPGLMGLEECAALGSSLWGGSTLFPALGGKTNWFVAFPDDARCHPIVMALREGNPNLSTIVHPSGRPFVVGNLSMSTPVALANNDRTVVAIGEHAITVQQLSDLSKHVGKLATVSGSFHLLVSSSGRNWISSPVSGLRRTFFVRTQSGVLASDRADVLASLVGAWVDDGMLALNLLSSGIPWPLSSRSVWRGVEQVSAGHYLESQINGRIRHHPWWEPPEPGLSISEGLESVRSEIFTSVNFRIRDKKNIASDLSGLDSTALCSILAQIKPSSSTILGITGGSPDVMDDDVRWARITAKELGIPHEIIDSECIPLPYSALLDVKHSFDEPFPMCVQIARFETLAERSRQWRADIRFSGFGGDEIFDTSDVWIPSLLRNKPWQAISAARIMRARNRWSRTKVAASLLDPRSYQRWLLDAARDIGTERRPAWEQSFGWAPRPTLPRWMSKDASDLIRDTILSASDNEPRSSSKGMHRALEIVQAGARIARQFQQVSNEAGVPLATPYFDDTVLNSALAVSPSEQLARFSYKPLLTEAMRGTVPDATLVRQTKSETSETVARGLEKNRSEILELMDDSELAKRGLIHLETFREFCFNPMLRIKHAHDLDLTIATEIWMRNVTSWISENASGSDLGCQPGGRARTRSAERR